MLKIRYHNTFKKDYKRVVRRGYNIQLLEKVIHLLCEQKPLPKKYNDRELSGDYAGFRECNITPDWLLVYEIKEDALVLVLTRTGTHSDLF